jgi:hypothetical protein
VYAINAHTHATRQRQHSTRTRTLWWEVSMIPWIMQRATNARRRHSHRRSGATLLGRSSEGEEGRMGGSSAAMRGAQANKGQRTVRIPRGEGKRAP